MNNYLIYNSILSRLLTLFYIDSCAIFDNNICYCLIYSNSLLLGNQLKFEIFNGFSCIEYQFYTYMLADLSIGKEAAIACLYPVVSILKLRPFRAFNPVACSSIKDYIVFFPQNLATLLTLFFSPIPALHNIIYIVWIGQERPINLNL